MKPLYSDLVIDLGTENTVFSFVGSTTMWSEPSVLAFKEDHRGQMTAYAAGCSALRMEGREPQGVKVMRPLSNGVITDSTAALAMLKTMLSQRQINPLLGFRRVLISSPYAISSLEVKAFLDVAWGLRPQRALLVAEPLAAAIGADLPIFQNTGQMLVDIGKGIVEAVITSQGHIVNSASARLAGRTDNERLIHHFAEHHSLAIGPWTAESTKRRLISREVPSRLLVSGQSLRWQRPIRIEVCADELKQAIAPSVQTILSCITEVLEQAPVELVTDIMEQGIYVTGGGALRFGLLGQLSRALGVAVRRVGDPLDAVAQGNFKILNEPNLLHELAS